ncbi:hypothetical protein [Aliarcobacter butzleri]|uniref:hypothetical protein n=1 Tax=Aliarcobacter butzleri TaxID=28197 RepID=UPI00214BF1FC|nr:hypothetical protein [Aliarcobacter butzleri]MCP3649136.1 hypothetical protein [Arcobacter sp. DNRA7]MCR1815310.1 hypothetical protein [Aliarcobacter butzleri]
MINCIFSKINKLFITSIFAIILGIITIFYPNLAQGKWKADDENTIVITGLIYTIIGIILFIYQCLFIYKNCKKN